MLEMINLTGEKLVVFIIISSLIWLFKEQRNSFIDKEKMIFSRMETAIKLAIKLKIELLNYKLDKSIENKKILFESLTDSSNYISEKLVYEMLEVFKDGNEIGDEILDTWVKSIENEISRFYYHQSERVPLPKNSGIFDIINYLINSYVKPFGTPVITTFFILLLIYLVIIWSLQWAKFETTLYRILYITNTFFIGIGGVVVVILIDALLKGIFNRIYIFIGILVYLMINGILIYKFSCYKFLGIILGLLTIIVFFSLFIIKEKKVSTKSLNKN